MEACQSCLCRSLCVCVTSVCSILQYCCLQNKPHKAGMCLLQWQTGKNKSAVSRGDVLPLQRNPSHSFFCCDSDTQVHFKSPSCLCGRSWNQLHLLFGHKYYWRAENKSIIALFFFNLLCSKWAKSMETPQIPCITLQKSLSVVS